MFSSASAVFAAKPFVGTCIRGNERDQFVHVHGRRTLLRSVLAPARTFSRPVGFAELYATNALSDVVDRPCEYLCHAFGTTQPEGERRPTCLSQLQLSSGVKSSETQMACGVVGKYEYCSALHREPDLAVDIPYNDGGVLRGMEGLNRKATWRGEHGMRVDCA